MPPVMLLSMPRLGPDLRDALVNWLSLKGDERRAVSLLIGLSSERSVPLDLRFLAAVQALEAFARVGMAPFELAPDEFQRRVTTVLESIEDQRIRAWAERKLKFANSRPLSVFLDNLISEIGIYVEGLAPDRRRFLDDVRNNRNFYTHRDDTRASNILEGEELYVLTQGVICLLKATVLRRTFGFCKDDTRAIMDECPKTRQWGIRVAQQYSSPDNSA